MQLLYSLSTSKFFASEHEGHDNGAQDAEEEGWPPFKKVGNFDPYSDDPRFSVQKIVLCSKTRTLTVAGAGGQVVMFGVSSEESSVEMQVSIPRAISPPMVLPHLKSHLYVFLVRVGGGESQ